MVVYVYYTFFLVGGIMIVLATVHTTYRVCQARRAVAAQMEQLRRPYGTAPDVEVLPGTVLRNGENDAAEESTALPVGLAIPVAHPSPLPPHRHVGSPAPTPAPPAWEGRGSALDGTCVRDNAAAVYGEASYLPNNPRNNSNEDDGDDDAKSAASGPAVAVEVESMSDSSVEVRVGN